MKTPENIHEQMMYDADQEAKALIEWNNKRRINSCNACKLINNGVKSRIALNHTCRK
jgi:hypothetical protein